MQLRIKCLIPFNNWERVIRVSPEPRAVCELMRKCAENFKVCDIYLERDGVRVAYAKWSARRGVHDLGCYVDLDRL